MDKNELWYLPVDTTGFACAWVGGVVDFAVEDIEQVINDISESR